MKGIPSAITHYCNKGMFFIHEYVQLYVHILCESAPIQIMAIKPLLFMAYPPRIQG